jgi:hypothetical protein
MSFAQRAQASIGPTAKEIEDKVRNTSEQQEKSMKGFLPGFIILGLAWSILLTNPIAEAMGSLFRLPLGTVITVPFFLMFLAGVVVHKA